MKRSPLTRDDLENLGSMVTVKESNTCLGYLMDFREHGIFDASYGKVPLTKEEKDTHNQLLDKAILEGMDTAKAGQFMPIPPYFNVKERKLTTFIGTVLQGNVTVTSGQVTLEKRISSGLQIWKGKLHKNDDCVNLKLAGIRE